MRKLDEFREIPLAKQSPTEKCILWAGSDPDDELLASLAADELAALRQQRDELAAMLQRYVIPEDKRNAICDCPGCTERRTEARALLARIKEESHA